ncbi:hypothetical protein P280DRAFT_305238 [Massarina eburnea CBS 473.64]|uniref:Uncharacterized protein n=1 Tax=Massarina eburnea CBS 473.64 TaxID=1395130 RepID=A0A6A6S055_9PLEO|nr:hypothetical protein P280DRAFT_305238 [Massarina eburnea CBS 473.64]
MNPSRTPPPMPYPYPPTLAFASKPNPKPRPKTMPPQPKTPYSIWPAATQKRAHTRSISAATPTTTFAEPPPSPTLTKRRPKTEIFKRGFRFSIGGKRRSSIITMDPKTTAVSPSSATDAYAFTPSFRPFSAFVTPEHGDGGMERSGYASLLPTPPTSPSNPEFIAHNGERERRKSSTLSTLRRSNTVGRYCARALRLSASAPIPQPCVPAEQTSPLPTTPAYEHHTVPVPPFSPVSAGFLGRQPTTTDDVMQTLPFPFGKPCSPQSRRGRDLGSTSSSICPITKISTSSSSSSASTPSPFEMHPGTLVDWCASDSEHDGSDEEEYESDEQDEYHAYLAGLSGKGKKNSLSYKVFPEERRKSVTELRGTPATMERRSGMMGKCWSDVLNEFPVPPRPECVQTAASALGSGSMAVKPEPRKLSDGSKMGVDCSSGIFVQRIRKRKSLEQRERSSVEGSGAGAGAGTGMQAGRIFTDDEEEGWFLGEGEMLDSSLRGR